MGTRSAIGLVYSDGTIRATYCHWDGYPDHHLPILKKHYGSKEKALKLIKPGSMSSLRSTHTWESEPIPDPEHGKFAVMLYEDGSTIYTHTRDPQPLYHHERGDVGLWNPGGGSYGDKPVHFNDQAACEKHFSGMDCEHLYLYRCKYGWSHYEL